MLDRVGGGECSQWVAMATGTFRGPCLRMQDEGMLMVLLVFVLCPAQLTKKTNTTQTCGSL